LTTAPSQGKGKLFDRLAAMVLDGTISASCDPSDTYALSDWQAAFKKAQSGSKSKVLLEMQDDGSTAANAAMGEDSAMPNERRW